MTLEHRTISYDTLAYGFNLDKNRRMTRLDDEVKLNIKILLKESSIMKSQYVAVKVPTGLTLDKIKDFQQYCLGERQFSKSKDPYKPFIEICPLFQVKTPMEGKYYLVESLPKNCFIY